MIVNLLLLDDKAMTSYGLRLRLPMLGGLVGRTMVVVDEELDGFFPGLALFDALEEAFVSAGGPVYGSGDKRPADGNDLILLRTNPGVGYSDAPRGVGNTDDAASCLYLAEAYLV